MKPKKSLYWTPTKILSFNRIFNIAIGSRGCGKSFSSKVWCISDFIKTKRQFVYLRRTQTELDQVKKSFFRDLEKEGYFEKHELEFDDGCYIVDGEVAGYPQALSTVGKIRSNSFPSVNKILFDEFLIERTGYNRYLNNEVMALLHVYETVDRGRDETRVLMLSNSTSAINPYFSNWGIVLQEGAIFQRVGKEIIVEIVNNEEFKEWKRQTRFGQFLEGIDGDGLIVENKFVNDNRTFVEKLSGHREPFCSIKFNGQVFAVWRMADSGMFYCDTGEISTIYRFAFNSAEQSKNTLLIKRFMRLPFMVTLIKAFDFGIIRYESLAVKMAMLEIFNLK